jgi:hypothetical protein
MRLKSNGRPDVWVAGVSEDAVGASKNIGTAVVC